MWKITRVVFVFQSEQILKNIVNVDNVGEVFYVFLIHLNLYYRIKLENRIETKKEYNMGSVEDITLDKIKTAHCQMKEKASKLFHQTPLTGGMEKRLNGQIPNVQSLSFKLESVQNTGINYFLYFIEFHKDCFDHILKFSFENFMSI